MMRKKNEGVKKSTHVRSTVMVCILLFFTVFFVFQISFSSTSGPRPVINLSTNQGTRHTTWNSTDHVVPHPLPHQYKQISCDRTHTNYDICSINGPTILDPTISTFFVVDPTNKTHIVEKIRPYARKSENFTMAGIKEFSLTSGPISLQCMVHHNAPALLFSAGGYTGNFFHDFNDGFIPLFITVNSIFSNRDFILVISKSRDWWISKYADLLHSFSKHPIIRVDNDTTTHCFTSATVGLMSHGFMTIDPNLMPSSKTFAHFRAFLEITYGMSRSSISKPPRARPRLVLASRSGDGGRVILNQDGVKSVAEEVGFEVIVFKPTSSTPLRNSYALINSSHALVGVHGAALTHSLFLPPGAVFVQIVPIGAVGVSDFCFGKSARDMGLEYMEYKIGVEESSLIEKYGKDGILMKNPEALQRKGWSHEIMDIYLRKQNVKLDLVRFRKYLKKAYRKAKVLMGRKEQHVL